MPIDKYSMIIKTHFAANWFDRLNMYSYAGFGKTRVNLQKEMQLFYKNC